ncbi:MAG: hypothetical protein ACETWB_01670, partial [Anaerolineae bacterium]
RSMRLKGHGAARETTIYSVYWVRKITTYSSSSEIRLARTKGFSIPDIRSQIPLSLCKNKVKASSPEARAFAHLIPIRLNFTTTDSEREGQHLLGRGV